MGNWKWVAIFSLGLMVSFAIAQDKRNDGPDASQLQSLQQKASYAIGLNIGRSIQRDDLELDPKVLAQGVLDGMSADAKPLLTDEQVQTVMQEFRQQLQEKSKQAAEENKQRGEDFLAKNGKKEGVVTLESGLQYEVLKEGKGATPKAKDTVSVHYHGTLIDGTVFDSTKESGEPINIGVSQVIPGWTEALQRMQVGDKWRVYIPSDLAYGPRGSLGGIGPNETLIFEIELISIGEAPQQPQNPAVPQ